MLQDQEFHRLGGTQSIRVDVRFVAATNKDLGCLVKAGTFREDLFYRLNVVMLAVPPLRERLEDVPSLAEFFLRRATQAGREDVLTITPAAMSEMLRYAWPGNIRELRNAIERGAILCRDKKIEPDDLGLPREQIRTEPGPRAEPVHLPYHDAMEQTSRRLLLDALRRSSWNQTKAADALGLQRTYLTKLLRQRGLSGRRPVSSEEGRPEKS